MLLITPDGNTILVDPPAPSSGYTLPFFGALDALLVSRDEANYNYVAAAQSDNVLVAARNGQFIPVDAQLSDARIQAVQSGPVGDQSPVNGVWVIDSPGLYMVHLGGLKGPLPSSPQLRPQPDVLFLPVGGGSVLDAAAAAQIVSQLKPGTWASLSTTRLRPAATSWPGWRTSCPPATAMWCAPAIPGRSRCKI